MMNNVKTRFAVAVLAVSLTGALAIIGYEEFKTEAYNDGTGTPTIGIGSVKVDGKPVKMGDTITPRKAVSAFASDVSKIGEASVKACVTVPLTQCEFDALVSLAYNIGQELFCSSTLVRVLNTGDYERAAELFTDPKYAFIKSKGKVLNGLIKRRAGERELFESGIYPEDYTLWVR